jgi:pyrimidine operon attenuation protein/uracil phosphoribosyltransferase
VELAILVDRGGRRLPVAADFVGLDLVIAETRKVRVTLDPLSDRRDSIRIESAAPARSARPNS